jgi:hypothetical protein
MATLKSDGMTLKLSEVRGRKMDLTVMTVLICTEAKFSMTRVFPLARQLVARTQIQLLRMDSRFSLQRGKSSPLRLHGENTSLPRWFNRIVMQL